MLRFYVHDVRFEKRLFISVRFVLSLRFCSCQVYESRNQHEEADKVRMEIEASEARIAAFEKSTQNGTGGGDSSQPQSATPTKPQVDFFNPTPEMKADALDKGLDLDDPAVLKILQKLQVGNDCPVLKNMQFLHSCSTQKSNTHCLERGLCSVEEVKGNHCPFYDSVI